MSFWSRKTRKQQANTLQGQVAPRFAPLRPLPDDLEPLFEKFQGHVYRHTRQPDGAGAQAWAYDNLGLMAFSILGRATGIEHRSSFEILQPIPLRTIQGVPLNGLGGLIAGQYIRQPLMLNPQQLADYLSNPPAAPPNV